MADFLSEFWVGLLVPGVLAVLTVGRNAFLRAVRDGRIDLADLERPILVFVGGFITVVASLFLGWALMHLSTWLIPWGVDATTYLSTDPRWSPDVAQQVRDVGLDLGGNWRWWGTLVAVLLPGLIYATFADAELNHRPGVVHTYLVPWAICLAVLVLSAGAVAVHLGVNWYLGSEVPSDFPMPSGLSGSLPWDVSWTAYLAAVIAAFWAINVTATWLSQGAGGGTRAAGPGRG
ncbi:hypothetical protein [Promicromonospora sukumoe]|uniref:ABC-type antimicrobial peptide transport system permease subunit n=1 Tax=Promicromonospora sukumoe TaxID=88382 RepID=A0A7W3PCN5_9MICO|nr:hypothetical protein [Promicromonospora sukumoe]MBA8806639.1 ABC-type antimicrobial peptide transport system permease subunit [Promicromonospora sukumoe]